jgi:hypothetical protein
MVGMYFDSILYQGDNTINSNTCKIHIQLHNCQMLGYFGDHMQTNTAMGEQGLKVWAKGASRNALKHGKEKFTYSTLMRVSERMLLDAIMDCLRLQSNQLQSNQQQDMPALPMGVSKRKLPHFHYERGGLMGCLKLLDQKGHEQTLMEQWASSNNSS